MHQELTEIPRRILEVAKGALTQANQHAVFRDPGKEHWDYMSVLNASLAGELFLKAIIAKQHPLLIFRDLFQLDDPNNIELTIEHIIEKGKAYGFEQLPKLLWVTTGERLPDLENFETLRKARNAVQHFCSPADTVDLRRVALEFIYNNVDPLINRHFGMCAIEYHEDHIGYDYIVECLLKNELLFSVPENFSVSEFYFDEALEGCSDEYIKNLEKRLRARGLELSQFRDS